MNPKQVSEISRKFLRLYCKIFNGYTESLHLFFGEDSVFRIEEKCREVVLKSWRASTWKGIKTLLLESFNEWKIALTDCKPKATSDTEIELEMSGTMYTKGFERERVFEQRVILSRCGDSFYVSQATLVLQSPPPSMETMQKERSIINGLSSISLKPESSN